MREFKFLPTAFVVALLLTASHAMAAGADQFIPASHGGFDLDLDVRAGAFSPWKTTDIQGLNALRATATVLQLGEDPRWAPGFNFEVYSGSESFMVQIYSANRKTLAVQVLHIVDGKATATIQWPIDVAVNEPLDVAIDWTEAGDVRFSFGAKGSEAFKLSGPATAIALTASTGEMALRDVRLGTTSH